jgi:hypothetical protein
LESSRKPTSRQVGHCLSFINSKLNGRPPPACYYLHMWKVSGGTVGAVHPGGSPRPCSCKLAWSRVSGASLLDLAVVFRPHYSEDYFSDLTKGGDNTMPKLLIVDKLVHELREVWTERQTRFAEHRVALDLRCEIPKNTPQLTSINRNAQLKMPIG